MRRAVVLAALALLLRAVVGMSAAQEGVVVGTGEQAGSPTEATMPETTNPTRLSARTNKSFPRPRE